MTAKNPHKWVPHGLYTNTAYQTFEFFRCSGCRAGKLGAPRPRENGVMGPYKVWDGREECPTKEEQEREAAEHRRISSEYALAERDSKAAALAQRQEEVRQRAEALGVAPEALPFTLDEARAIYDAGYASGYESGADGGSFEAALRELGRSP